jgi:2-C-methyl-D-erythritol 4-phosphate cytidylyltransferase
MVTAILLAAGKGLRLKSNVTPKQFLRIKQKKLYQFALNTFVKNQGIHEIILVVNESALTQVQDEVKPWAKKKPIHVIAGGKTRQESSYQGLLYAQLHQKPDFVFIHDVARPLISAQLIDKISTQLKRHSAITLGRHVNDSLFVVDEEATLRTYVEKEDIYLVQTPQAFQFQLILDAHEYARKLKITTAMDDASLLTLVGKKVHVIPGSRLNFKIVTEDDLLLLKALLKTR